MQIYIMDDKVETVRFGLKESDSTIIEPVIEELNKIPEVVYARYIVDHPDLLDHILEVKVNPGCDPKAILLQATQNLHGIYQSIGIQ